MIDYKKEIVSYLDEIKSRKKYSLDIAIEGLSASKYVCVFGIGEVSSAIIHALRKVTDISVDFLCDNDDSKWGNIYYDNLRCISPDELAHYGDDVTIIIATRHYQEIYQQLKKIGIKKICVINEYRLLNNEFFRNKDNIEAMKQNAVLAIDILEDEESKDIFFTLIKNWFEFDVTGVGYRDIFTEDQYYSADIIKLQEDESFVDAGAYNGDTLFEFIKRSSNKFDSIFAFELDKDNYKEMEARLNKLTANLKNKISLFNLGLFDEEKFVAFDKGSSGQNACINVISSAKANTKTVRLSDILKEDKVTFIKMDIEGSEIKALQGAEEIIKKQKPKLAICVYHRPDHLWEVPLYIKKIVPEYKIYIRHHTPLEYETVCYAVI